jgi:hypothetical protein
MDKNEGTFYMKTYMCLRNMHVSEKCLKQM